MEQGSEREKLRQLILSGVRRIRKTWAKLGSPKLGAGAYGKQELLQEIYTVYCGWRDGRWTKVIWKRLAKGLRVESSDPAPHLLTLLIEFALPEVKAYVAANWVNAIRFGESNHVRPFKLHAFLYLKGGLARCARLYKEEERTRQDEEENRRLDSEEREARIRQGRQEAISRRNALKKPAGRFGLFD